MNDLVFLKLGGSLITDKDQRATARVDVLARLAGEIAAARAARPGLRLLIGHGSGSFGHTAASKHNTRQGVRGEAGWLGFAEVWREARALNEIVLAALLSTGLPVVALPPSAWLTAFDGQPAAGNISPLRQALRAGLVPLVNGDTIFDDARGGTILSTEDVFMHLAPSLQPARVLLAGREPGVFSDFPACTHLLETLTPALFARMAGGIGGSASVDVTGGMGEKVRLMLELVERQPGFEACIFSGLPAGSVERALLGERVGTRIGA